MFNASSNLGSALRGRITCLFLLLCAHSGEAAGASNLCADLEMLVVQAQSDFSNGSIPATELKVPVILPDAESCALTRLLSGSMVYHCIWTFPYRAAEAYARFEAMNRTLQECFGSRARATRDQSVNHPDFYDLRRYELDQANLTVSIKDKSALQRTYVFLRVYAGTLD